MRLDLKTVLKRRGTTQRSVAQAIGISAGYMSGLCSGDKSPSNDILIRIAEHLEVTPNDLYDLESESAFSPTPSFISSAEIRSTPLSAHHVAAATTLYPKLGSAAGYQSRTDLPQFYICEGDLLVVDEKTHPASGDLVVIGGVSPRIARNVGATTIRLIDHAWSEVAPANDGRACHPVVALLRAGRQRTK